MNERLIQYYLSLIGLAFTPPIDAKATPIKDTDYRYHIIAVELVSQSYGSVSHHQLLIALGVDTHTQTSTYTDVRTEAILKNQVSTELHVPGLHVY